MSRLIPAALTGLALLVAPVKTEAISCVDTLCWSGGDDKMPDINKVKPPKSGPFGTEYIVGRGETLGKIAKRLTGDPKNYVIFQRYNKIEDPRQLRTGQTLHLPSEFVTEHEGQTTRFRYDYGQGGYRSVGMSSN